ncbi:MAG TPA: efflux RND transporter periplasmic adaptor subunit [Caulifigura sp.]|nr:efflux RND transporter periplasmic adaptor subunit [Caulifigura sp.]
MTSRHPAEETLTPMVAHPSRRPHRLHARGRRRVYALLVVVITGIAIAAKMGVLSGLVPSAKKAVAMVGEPSPPQAATPSMPTAKVVRPRAETGAELVFERIATVEPYYRADLRARASGLVKAVHYDIGETVKRGDLLIEIDVPEFERDVTQKEALIKQRWQELRVAEANQRNAVAAKSVSAAAITQKQAEAQAITATRDLKKRKYERYQELAERKSIVGSVVEEEERDYKSSEGQLAAAEANIARAKADHEESIAKVDAATAAVDLVKAQTDVTREDLERAKVIAGYANVIAPFDGVVVRRNVDPGSFVQNATTGSSEALISIARIDLVTVVANFPDNAAPYIADGIPAVIEITDLPGATIPASVTRFSPTIQNSDRTIRVEVDLYNGNESGRQSLRNRYGSTQASLQLKGSDQKLPLAAFPADEQPKTRLLPGMNGSIKLAIGGSRKLFVLPSTAVYSRGGATYLLLVKDGKTVQVRVHVQLNDGQVSRVSLVERSLNRGGAEQETLKELTGDEQVVVANQLQIGEGVDVRAVPTEW